MSAEDRNHRHTTDIAFSDAVKEIQARLGSRDSMERLERSDTWPDEFGHELSQALGETDSFFLATASADGQPYVQHRGGEPGFVTIRDRRTAAFPDYAGNRHYITLGNLSENPRCCILLIDFRRAIRYKLWGDMSVENLDGPDRQLVFSLTTWDRNCPKYIPRRHDDADIRRATQRLQWRIDALETELAALRGATDG
ncbi:MAG: pyridoxamine 5'-phosphate oxidase [Gammaproteobacteria bacterium]|nr:MAG: pyridoxamine 5'-phosphate oxidase [Gammaproteobacteria bacterium]